MPAPLPPGRRTWSRVAFTLTSSAALALAGPGVAQDCAFPTVPSVRNLEQPDGSPIQLYFRGTGFNHWYEDLEGYPVVSSARGYVYAQRAAGGELEATEALVGASDPLRLGLVAHVVPTPPPRPTTRALSTPDARSAGGAQGATAPAPHGELLTSGSVKNLVILLRFSDHGPSGQNRVLPSSADVTTIMNAVGGDPVLAPTGSVRDHYQQTSYGMFSIDSTVVGWLDVPGSELFYTAGNSGLTTQTWSLITAGLNAADPLVNFSDFDEDGDGWIDAITFLHSGYGAEWGGTDQYGRDYHDRMWSHKWTIPTWTSAEGVKVGDYNISPGLWATSGSSPGRIGVVCHELGHFFGMPDEYDTDGSGEGAGNWCLMAGGSWGFDGTQQHPSHLCAWSKMKLGFLSPERLLPGTKSLAQIETNSALYMLDSGYPAGEYLLIENREATGFDAALPQSGLAIWHVDEGKGSFTNNDVNNDEGFPGQAGWPTNGRHYRVGLLAPDGSFDLEQGFGRGDSGDVYRLGFATQLTHSTNPDSDAYQGGTIVNTGNRIQSIGAPGASMSFTYSNTSSPAITTTSLPTAKVGSNYTATLTRTGGSSPFAWSEFRDAPSYSLTDLGAQTFGLGGTAQNFRADEAVWSVNLPFAFPYYETSYTKVYVNPNGCVDLAPLANEASNTTPSLRCLPRIACLWDDLITNGAAGQDIFLDTSVSGQVRIRWRGQTFDTGTQVNCAVTLRSNGDIKFEYGASNTTLTPTVGISRGHSGDLTLAPTHDAHATLTNAHALQFSLSSSQLPPGMTLSSAGVLSGKPTTPGTYTFRVRVTDNGRRYDQKQLSLVVVPFWFKERQKQP